MSKSYLQNAEEMSIFLSPIVADVENDKKSERSGTKPLREARFIDIEKIAPDPNQPRKQFVKETIESLAESIREFNGIIDPLTVQWDETGPFFRIINGERRYRAAKIAGLERLPCIIKHVVEKKKLLLQLVTNLQRENITPLEESAGINLLIQRDGYSQARIAKLLNKSKSYVSQILGLRRLSPVAREIVQTSELPKEIQIQASREKKPEKQVEILEKASKEGKTVREMRQKDKTSEAGNPGKHLDSIKPEGTTDESYLQVKEFRKWEWEPEDRRFLVHVQFRRKQNKSIENQLVKEALSEAHSFVTKLIHKN